MRRKYKLTGVMQISLVMAIFILGSLYLPWVTIGYSYEGVIKTLPTEGVGVLDLSTSESLVININGFGTGTGEYEATYLRAKTGPTVVYEFRVNSPNIYTYTQLNMYSAYILIGNMVLSFIIEAWQLSGLITYVPLILLLVSGILALSSTILILVEYDNIQIEFEDGSVYTVGEFRDAILKYLEELPRDTPVSPYSERLILPLENYTRINLGSFLSMILGIILILASISQVFKKRSLEKFKEEVIVG